MEKFQETFLNLFQLNFYSSLSYSIYFRHIPAIWFQHFIDLCKPSYIRNHNLKNNFFMTNLHIFSFSLTWFLHTWICLLNYSYIMCRVIFSFSTVFLYFAENIFFVFKGYNIITIYIIKQDIRIYVVYGRPNGWTNWAEIFDNTYGRPRSVTGYKKY